MLHSGQDETCSGSASTSAQRYVRVCSFSVMASCELNLGVEHGESLVRTERSKRRKTYFGFVLTGRYEVTFYLKKMLKSNQAREKVHW